MIYLNRRIFSFVYNLQANLRVKLTSKYYNDEAYKGLSKKSSSYINYINNHTAMITGTATLSYIRLFSDLIILISIFSYFL